MEKIRQRRFWAGRVFAAAVAAWAAGGCGEPEIALPHAERLLQIKSIAVLPFVDAYNARGSGELVVTAAMTQLYRTPGLRVYERSRLKALIDEHDLARAMASASAAEVASRIGKLTGVDAVVVGEVSQYEAQQESGSLTVYVVSGSQSKPVHRVGLFVRAVDVRDGTILYTDSGEGQSQTGYTGAAEIAVQEAFRPWLQFFNQRARAKQS